MKNISSLTKRMINSSKIISTQAEILNSTTLTDEQQEAVNVILSQSNMLIHSATYINDNASKGHEDDIT